jgi:hypothetical protein
VWKDAGGRGAGHLLAHPEPDAHRTGHRSHLRTEKDTMAK